MYHSLKVTRHISVRIFRGAFCPSIRVIGSLLFVIFHLGRIAIVIYLPTLAITAVSDMNPFIVASLVGILCILYISLRRIRRRCMERFHSGVILLGGALMIIVIGALKSKEDSAQLSVMQLLIRRLLVQITEIKMALLLQSLLSS